MIPERIEFSLEGGMDFPLPRMVRVRQKFDDAAIGDIAKATRDAIEAVQLPDLAGRSVALTAGSRQIPNLAQILKTVAVCLRERGALPFIVPAMGSHGGATAKGQVSMLEGYGITEESVGMPILSSMETVQIGTLANGYPVYCDKHAAQADYIAVIGRIKPHTSISGEIESGLCKMMVVGLGKHAGATSFHRQGYDKLAEILPQGVQVFLNRGILFGIGIVENAFDRTMKIEVVPPETLIEREKELLKLAKENMPRLLLDEIDVLIIDRIGKDVSGAGMDPNVTGRAIAPVPVKIATDIKLIAVLDVTPASHGNATGIGGADITTKWVIEKIDFHATYTNVFTSGALMAAKLPVIVNSDEEAIRVCLRCAPRERMEDVKVVRIRDTLHLSEIEVSENYLPVLSKDVRFEVLSKGEELRFDGDGRIV